MTPLIFLHSHSVSQFYLFRMMFDFQKIEVYTKAKAFHKECKKLVAERKPEAYVKDQLSRASFSIPLNIAEGSGRFSKADRRNFFVIARSSVFECVAILDIFLDENLVSQTEFDVLCTKADELSRILYAMIRNLSAA